MKKAYKILILFILPVFSISVSAANFNWNDNYETSSSENIWSQDEWLSEGFKHQPFATAETGIDLGGDPPPTGSELGTTQDGPVGDIPWMACVAALLLYSGYAVRKNRIKHKSNTN